MPLVKATLEEDLLNLNKTMLKITDSDEGMKTYSKEMASIIDKYIKTATVNVTVTTVAGQAVAGMAGAFPVVASTTTPGTGTGVGTLS